MAQELQSDAGLVIAGLGGVGLLVGGTVGLIVGGANGATTEYWFVPQPAADSAKTNGVFSIQDEGIK